MIRVAAVGDIHVNASNRGRLRPHLEGLGRRADLLLLAGDLTCLGTTAEAEVVADELRPAVDEVPVLAVLGNHDHHSDEQVAVAGVLGRAGVRVLEGDAETVDCAAGVRVGVAGGKGFGGGFVGVSASEFGEVEFKAFARHGREAGERLRGALQAMAAADARLVVLHYAPIAGTLEGERPELHAFLGSHFLGDAVDEVGADLVVHGHAHAGCETGSTPAGVAVRNVAQPVLGRPLAIYGVEPGRRSVTTLA
ncbi:MAG TPA: metallophosphoesterase [Acidimicrobiales bacterium]|nr:metallophosphoesterase [Acidimicrobiales bacterium]